MAITFHAQVATHIGWMAARAGPGQPEGTFNDVAERLHFNPQYQGPKRFNAQVRSRFRRRENLVIPPLSHASMHVRPR